MSFKINDTNKCPVEVDVHAPPFWQWANLPEFQVFTVPRFQLQLLAIYFITTSFHQVLRRLHFPRFVSEVLAGVILGPTGLGHIPGFTVRFFPQEENYLLDAISKIGYIFFIFLSGVKMDPSLILAVGTNSYSAWVIGVLAAAIPFAGGMKVFSEAHRRSSNVTRIRTFKTIISVNCLIAFPVISALLVDLKIMNSELGRLALTSTLIADLLSTTLSIIANNAQLGYAGWMDGYAVLTGFMTLSSIAFMIATMQPLSRWILRQTPEGKPINRAHVLLLSLSALMSSIFANNIGIPYQLGPFLLGLSLPDGPPIGSTLVNKLDTVMCGWLTPIIVTYTGMKIDVWQLYNLDFMGIIRMVVVSCQAMKFGAILFPALACKVPLRDSFALAFIMSTQGIVQLTYYSNFFISQAFDQEIFLLLTSCLLQTAIGSQLGAKFVYNQSRRYISYQKRDIQHLSLNSELRMLTCSHRADDVIAVKKILQASFLSTIENPLAVYALNLVELVGRAHPLLIDHQTGQRTSVIGLHAQKALEIFQSIQQQYIGRISIQIFTSVSLPMFMYHDICSVAFDKLTSIIILPFHKKWNPQGKLIVDSGFIRSMNLNVLENAPCSIGILIDRHRIKNQYAKSSSSNTYNIAVVFISGSDDREALAYARRMVRAPGVHLTVIRFVPWDCIVEQQWDSVLDAETLKEIRLQGLLQQDDIFYKEEKVRDGSDTALQLHAMEECFDLIMVGRRHREECQQLSGLNEWTDLAELGSVGDIFAAVDINKPVSILVVQQQIVRTQ